MLVYPFVKQASMKQIITFLLIAISSHCFAQTVADTSKQIPVGHWRTHLTYLSVTQVAETPEKVYGVSDGALFSYTKEDNNFDVYSKIDGLSDNNITLIKYSVENKLLLIVYENSNIDILTDEGDIFNILDIKEKTTSLNKTINNVSFFGNKAYLATGYGISIINLVKHEISDTYLLNKNTLSSIIFNNKIYAGTAKGIWVAPISTNLIDPSNWTQKDSSLIVNQFVNFKEQLIALNINKGLYVITETGNQKFYSSDVLSGIIVSQNVLIAFGQWQVSYFSSTTEETTISATDLYGLSSLSPNNTTWIASLSNGLSKIEKQGDNYVKTIVGKPDGPLANNPYKLKFSGNKLMIVGGRAWDNRAYARGLMMFYENDVWDYMKVDTISDPRLDNGVRDFVDIVEDPREKGHYFVASYGEGVYEFRNKKLVKLHDHSNSTIETVNIDVLKGMNHYDRTYGLCYDKNYNLYVMNSFTPNIIKVLTKDGVWTSLNYQAIANNEAVFDIMQTRKGVFWVLCPWSNPGIFAFDPKTTLTNQTDDQFKFFSTINYLDNLDTKSISPGAFFCLAEDKNGAIWAGTDMGPIVFNSPSKVFTETFMGSRIKVPRNDGTNLADYLLENEKITTIAIDGGNRKWIGTESNGVYLVSENGQETFFHFTSENSPLLSNKVSSIAIHPLTGEVFMGTDKGLISYRSDAIEGKKSYSNVYAFPNPIKPDYEGLITITGLMAKSTVRITDLNGNSIFEGTSEGGQISWNGRNRQGNRLASGVYLVYAALSDATDGIVTKILILK